MVIDFEYASANVPGLEFANHFVSDITSIISSVLTLEMTSQTEWCYNYHDPDTPYALDSRNYPTPDEQRRFIKSYVQHRPQFHPRASMTPTVAPNQGQSASISSFMLDSRAPPAQVAEEERRRAEAAEAEVQRLMDETRLWRVANSAQWVAWGVVQAKVPGMDQALPRPNASHSDLDKSPSQSPQRKAVPPPSADIGIEPSSPGLAVTSSEGRDKVPEGLIAKDLQGRSNMATEVDDEEGFDYLGYAQERAMFCWGDLIRLGIVRKEELPSDLIQKAKVIDY